MKKFIKMPLFWSTVVLGLLTIIFAFATFSLADRVDAINAALDKYGMYYDEKDDDIYRESSTNKTSYSSSSSEEESEPSCKTRRIMQDGQEQGCNSSTTRMMALPTVSAIG